MHISLREIYFTGHDMILYKIIYLHPFMPMVVKCTGYLGGQLLKISVKYILQYTIKLYPKIFCESMIFFIIVENITLPDDTLQWCLRCKQI